MYLVYVGESGNTGTSLNDSNQPHYVCVGLMVHEDKWNAIKVGFSRVCHQYFNGDLGESDGPVELHAAEILHGKGFFSSWPKARRLQLIDDLLDILIRHETPVIVSYVDKQDFATSGQSDPLQERQWQGPWEPAFSRLLFSLDIYMDEINMLEMDSEALYRGEPVRIRQRATIIADQDKSVDPQAMKELLKTEMELPTGAVLDSMQFARSQDSHCTQLADLCAYFARRRFHHPTHPNPQYGALESGHVIQVVYPVQFS